MIAPLQPPDTHHLNAAIGWMGLGNYEEAKADVERISEKNRAHPEVLAVLWRIYAHQKKWKICVDLSEAIVEQLPHDPLGWNDLSIALYKGGATEAAWQLASSRLTEFPKDWQLHYNCACYAAQLGNLERAKDLLYRAMELGDKNGIKQLIQDDPDLDPLKKEMKF